MPVVSCAQLRLVILLFPMLCDDYYHALSWGLDSGGFQRPDIVTTGNETFSKCLADPEKSMFGAEFSTSPSAGLHPGFKLCAWKNGDRYDLSSTTRCNTNLTRTSVDVYFGQLWFPQTHQSQAHEVQLILEWDWEGLPEASFCIRNMRNMSFRECKRRYINTTLCTWWVVTGRSTPVVVAVNSSTLDVRQRGRTRQPSATWMRAAYSVFDIKTYAFARDATIFLVGDSLLKRLFDVLCVAGDKEHMARGFVEGLYHDPAPIHCRCAAIAANITYMRAMTSHEVTTRVRETVGSLRSADFLLFNSGHVFYNARVAKFQKTLGQLWDILSTLPRAQQQHVVHVSHTKPMVSRFWRNTNSMACAMSDYLFEQRQACVQPLCAASSVVCVSDFVPRFMALDALAIDGVHFHPRAYAVMAQSVGRAIKRAHQA